MFRYATIMATLRFCSDRFLSSGYGKEYDSQELFEEFGGIDDLSGVELVSGADVTPDSLEEVKGYLNRYNLQVVSIVPNHFGSDEWSKGAFTSPDESIRERAVEEAQSAIDMARELGCDLR